MKLYNYFTLFVALTISACAAYYSIVGLTAIFAASVIPVIIMGSVLELAKITGAVWLKLYWNQASWWLKFYLVPAVAVLMVITSIGIFGFLSRAHIEQTAAATAGAAQIERIDDQIVRQEEIVARAELEIENLQSAGIDQDARIEEQIAAEQQRIDSAYARIQPAIDEQTAIIERETSNTSRWEEQLTLAETNLAALDAELAANNVEAAQARVGTAVDGALGPATRAAISAYRAAQEQRRADAAAQIAELESAPPSAATVAAREEIARLRGLAEEQITSANELVARLRAQLGTTDQTAVSLAVDEQIARISQANTAIDLLLDEKFELESVRRALEAEVGPIRYVAEMIYGEANTDLLEQSVRWLILLLVAVFDPLAVILTLAAISGIKGFAATTPDRKQSTLTVETKIVEVPVEVIKEVERVVEVPVEVPVEVLREVEVEKIVEVTVEDNEKIDELAAEVEDLLNTVEKQKKLIQTLTQTQPVRNQPVVESDFDLGDVSGASFGSTWPVAPVKGQLFLKVDTLPNKLYKWNGRKWIEIDIARIEDTLAYDEKYIKYLIQEIKQGRREYEDLSSIEQSQIKSYIMSNGNNQNQ